MSGWRVERHYGFGAARVSLSAAHHRHNQSIAGAMRDAGPDFYLSALPPMIMAAFISAALFVTVSEDKGYTDLEVAMIEREIHGLDQEIAEVPPVVEPEPAKPPEPPPVQKIVEKKPEPPPVKKIEPPKPPPVQKIAKVKPKPKPKPPPRAKPKPKPKLELAAIAPIPKAKAPEPARRVVRKAPKAAPKIDLMPAIAPALALKAVDEPEPPRRFASVRQAPPSRRPKADFGVPIAARALTAPPPEPPPVRSRRASKRAPAAAPRKVAPLNFAAAATSMPASPARQAPERRRNRPVPAVERPKRAAPPPSIAPALAAAAPRELAKAVTPATSRAQRERDRTQRNAGTRRRANHAGGRGMQGVPLASLASCLSDREEDALKRRLVAAVKTQSECVSPAGTYRFVETKNLNAFLMTIEQAPGRAVADRCVELSYAIECLER